MLPRPRRPDPSGACHARPRHPWPAGTPCWVDIAVPDVPRATSWYGAVLGWEVHDMGEEYGHYGIARVGGHDAAGMGPHMFEGQPTQWCLYLATDDIDASAKLVREHGGSLVVEPMEVPGNGHMAVAVDPTGGVFGLWQATDMIGSAVVNEPGGLVWEDARLTDVAAGRRFFAAVFDYTYQPVEGLGIEEYGTFHRGGDPLGGMGGMMGAAGGSHWLAYFSVADMDAALDAVRDGGTVLSGPDDTPYGRMAVVADPFGATFGLFGALPA